MKRKFVHELAHVEHVRHGEISGLSEEGARLVLVPWVSSRARECDSPDARGNDVWVDGSGCYTMRDAGRDGTGRDEGKESSTGRISTR